jgi:hypothetical protein
LQQPPPPTHFRRLQCRQPPRPLLQHIRARSDGAATARCKCAWRFCDVTFSCPLIPSVWTRRVLLSHAADAWEVDVATTSPHLHSIP